MLQLHNYRAKMEPNFIKYTEEKKRATSLSTGVFFYSAGYCGKKKKF